MGQQVVYIQNNLDGLRLKGVGVFGKGAKWPVNNAPEKLIEKMKNNETFMDSKNRRIPIASCFSADGSEIDFKNAYIEKFGIGDPPIPPVIHESSNKPRKISRNKDETSGDNSPMDNEVNSLEENSQEDNESPEGEDIVNDEDLSMPSDENDSSEESDKKKKKKLKKKSQ